MFNIIEDDAVFENALNGYEEICMITESVLMEAGIGDVFKSIGDGLNKILMSISDTVCSAMGTASNKNSIASLRDAIAKDPSKGTKVIKISDIREMSNAYSKLIDFYEKTTLELLSKMDKMTPEAVNKSIKEITKKLRNEEQRVADMEFNTVKVTVNDVLKKYGSNGDGFTMSVKQARETYRKKFDSMTAKLKKAAGNDPRKQSVVYRISTNAGKATAMSFRSVLKLGTVAALAGVGIGIGSIAVGQLTPDKLDVSQEWIDPKGNKYTRNPSTEKHNSLFSKMAFNKIKKAYLKGENSKEFQTFLKSKTAHVEMADAYAYAKSHCDVEDKRLMSEINRKLPALIHDVTVVYKDGKPDEKWKIRPLKEEIISKKPFTY